MTYSHIPHSERLKLFLGENIRHKAVSAMVGKNPVIINGYAAAFLTAVRCV